MKKLFVLLLCCILFVPLIFLSACSANNNDDLFTIKNESSGVELKLGMSRSEIESLLGTAYVTSGNVGFSRDDIAVIFALRLSDDESSPVYDYQLSNGISLNSSYEDFKKAYPNASVSGSNQAVYYLSGENGFTDITDKYDVSKKGFPDDIDRTLVYCINLGSNKSDAQSPDYLYISTYTALIYAQFDINNMLKLI